MLLYSEYVLLNDIEKTDAKKYEFKDKKKVELDTKRTHFKF